MSENKDYFSQAEELGTIHISEEVLAGIAAAATLEVEGVGSLSAPLSSDLVDLLGKKNLAKGVRIQLEEECVQVVIAVMMNYGFTIPQVANAVQEAVKNAVEAMSGLTVSAVNVTISGILFPPVQK